MVLLWDYDKKELEKSKQGRIKILEHQINYGPDEEEKIDLKQVKKHWDQLHIPNPRRRRYLEYLIWGK